MLHQVSQLAQVVNDGCPKENLIPSTLVSAIKYYFETNQKLTAQVVDRQMQLSTIYGPWLNFMVIKGRLTNINLI